MLDDVARRRAHMPEGFSGILNTRSLEASHRRLGAQAQTLYLLAVEGVRPARGAAS